MSEKDAAEKPAPKAPTTAKYVVKNAPIAPFGNSTGGDPDVERLYDVGEVVDLPTKLARHYTDLDRLAPYIPEEGDELL